MIYDLVKDFFIIFPMLECLLLLFVYGFLCFYDVFEDFLIFL